MLSNVEPLCNAAHSLKNARRGLRLRMINFEILRLPPKRIQSRGLADVSSGMLNELRSACEAAGITPVGATIKEIADDVLALPGKKEPFVCEGAIFDLQAERAEIAAVS